MSQTSFSLYLHNQWTDFHEPSCTGKPQIRLSVHIWDVQKRQQMTEISGHQ